MRHTPGPWKVVDGERGRVFVLMADKVGCEVAEVCTENIEDEAQVHADARLIAAAPELLDALRDLAHRADTTELADGSSLDTAWASALLARIEGGGE